MMTDRRMDDGTDRQTDSSVMVCDQDARSGQVPDRSDGDPGAHQIRRRTAHGDSTGYGLSLGQGTTVRVRVQDGRSVRVTVTVRFRTGRTVR